MIIRPEVTNLFRREVRCNYTAKVVYREREGADRPIVLYIPYTMMSAQQMNLLPENTSQNNAIFAHKSILDICDHLTIHSSYVSLHNHHSMYIWYILCSLFYNICMVQTYFMMLLPCPHVCMHSEDWKHLIYMVEFYIKPIVMIFYYIQLKGKNKKCQTMPSVSHNTDLNRPVLREDFDTIVRNKDAEILRQNEKIQMLEEELEVIIYIYIAVSVSFGNYIYIHIYIFYVYVLDQTWFDILHFIECAKCIIREMYQTTKCKN